MNKVCKIPLIVEIVDKQGNKVDYKEVYKWLWSLQNEVKTIKNKTIQLCWEWNNYSSDYKIEHGVYPKDKDVLNYTLSGYIYDRLKYLNTGNTSNFTSSTRDAISKFKAEQKDVVKGDKSIVVYKSNQPIDLHNKSIRIYESDGEYYCLLSLFNKLKCKEYNISDCNFKMYIKDNGTRTIVGRCVSGEYGISGSQLIYDKKKKLWNLYLSYKFETSIAELDSEKILGIDLGCALPFMASVKGDYDRLSVTGKEITIFRYRIEQRRKELLKQTKVCGDGRIGHGRKTRCKPAINIEDKIARFRDTTNHKYSRAIVDYAKKNGCGVIQMEDLTGITKDAEPFLKNWSYYDLQTKIEYKAKEEGIEVVKVKPKYTSQRCSKCGCISAENRKTQANFKCVECGFTENADYNASQNIATKNIDKIIDEYMKNHK